MLFKTRKKLCVLFKKLNIKSTVKYQCWQLLIVIHFREQGLN